MRLLLIRKDTSQDGTDGVLTLPSGFKINTLELPWLDNAKDISCIPFGIYQCKKIVSPRFGETFEVCDVPSREHILFHKGNKLTDSKGCILLGSGRSIGVDGKDQLVGSASAFDRFKEEVFGYEEIELEIR